MDDARKIDISLTPDEAIVLFEWLARENERGKLPIVDQAEQRALWNLEATLESVLTEPLLESYETILGAARDRLRDSDRSRDE